MREILFRGKRTDNDEWIFGRVFRLSERLNPFIMLVVGEFKDVDSDDIYPYNGWHIEVFGHCISIMEPAADGIEIEIIGNIHDNPELVEVEKV